MRRKMRRKKLVRQWRVMTKMRRKSPMKKSLRTKKLVRHAAFASSLSLHDGTNVLPASCPHGGSGGGGGDGEADGGGSGGGGDGEADGGGEADGRGRQEPRRCPRPESCSNGS